MTDADTGLVLMGYRYYDSRTGRFLTQDPAGSGDNWYAYADNNPTNEIDPDGLFADPNPSGMLSPNGGDQTDTNWVVNHEEQNAISSFSTWAATVQLYLVRTDDYHNGQGPQVDGVWPLAAWQFGGGGIATQSNNNMQQMRLPKNWLEVLVGVLLGGLSPVGHKDGPTKAPESNPPPPIVQSDNKKKNKETGSSFEFDLGSTERSISRFVNGVADGWQNYQRDCLGGGKGGYTFGIPPLFSNPYAIP